MLGPVVVGPGNHDTCVCNTCLDSKGACRWQSNCNSAWWQQEHAAPDNAAGEQGDSDDDAAAVENTDETSGAGSEDEAEAAPKTKRPTKTRGQVIGCRKYQNILVRISCMSLYCSICSTAGEALQPRTRCIKAVRWHACPQGAQGLHVTDGAYV